MTREQLDAIRARVEAATLGPWEAVTPKRYAAVRSDAERCYVYTQGKIPADTHPDTVARQQRDAQFIASAREDVPALLAEVERLTADPLPAAAWVREVERAAFARGVAAMREAAAQKVTSYNIVVVDPAGRAFPVLESPLQTLADELRALPDPEDKS